MSTIDPALVSNLANAFVADLRQYVSAEEFAEIRRRNATPDYARACASHDFVDANECMAAAFKAVMGRDPYYMPGNFEPGEDLYQPDTTEEKHEADNRLWGAAWDLAKARSLTAPAVIEDAKTYLEARQ